MTNGVIWQIYIFSIIHFMNPIVSADKFLEIIWQEIRHSTTEYLRTSDRVTRTITAVTCILWEAILNTQDWANISHSSGRLGVYALWFFVSELYAKKKWVKNQSNEWTIDPNIFFLSLNRLWMLIYSWTVMMRHDKADFLGIFAYIAISFHNSDWKTIKNWLQKKIIKNKPLAA